MEWFQLYISVREPCNPWRRFLGLTTVHFLEAQPQAARMVAETLATFPQCVPTLQVLSTPLLHPHLLKFNLSLPSARGTSVAYFMFFRLSSAILISI